MAKIQRLDDNVKAFATDALSNERTIFGTTTTGDDTLDNNVNADFLRGWGIVGPSDEPTREDFNALGFVLGQFISYLHQVGVPEWNGKQEYHQYSMANEDGNIYVCKTNDHTSVTPPSSDTSNWDQLQTALKTFYDDSDSGLGVNNVKEAIDKLISGSSVTVITASDSSWAPKANTKFIVFDATGAGGSGGSTAGGGTGTSATASGGGSGGRSVKSLENPSTTFNITIGAGGSVPSAGNNNGIAGGDTTIVDNDTGSIVNISAGGGGGGQGVAGTASSNTRNGALGGTATGGDINTSGNSSATAMTVSGDNASLGNGAGSWMGGASLSEINGDGDSGGAPGAGGAGACSVDNSTNRVGGAGADGIVIITEFF